jgi:peptidoglycan hydrolase-like protein with peptidoglycan-binding domain
MQLTYAAPRARLGPPALALALAALAVLAAAAAAPAHAGGRDSAGELVADPAAGWHGRAIRRPRPRPQLVRTAWPAGWSAGAVGIGTGFVRPGGSDRVRDVQRRLVQLGYRPGPVDGLFGPRTRAAVRWFQYKHGLPTPGRVNRSTLAVLHARSDHEPLRTRTREQPRDETRTTTPAAPRPAPAVPAESGRDYTAVIILALLAALALGVITGLFGPELRRGARTVPTRPDAAKVLGYATDDANTATEAIAGRCARSGWTLTEVVRDPRQPSRRLAERRGLAYALGELRNGTASGLVAARLHDIAPRSADLATLVHWLEEANAFLAAADHELDTSTEAGQATARAIVELGAWERRSAGDRRFTPSDEEESADLAEQLVAMVERGIPPSAVTSALVLTGLAGRAAMPDEEGRRM